MKKTPTKKKSESKSKKSKYQYAVVELPSDNSAMENYIQKHREEINEKIVDAIEYAMHNRLGGVEIFCFKGSSFVVVLNRKDFKDSLENIFEFGMEKEKFEICAKVKQLIRRMDKLSHISTYKKIK
jgi:hypothetical protein